MSSDSGSAARAYGRRADAERNREIVLDHAVRLLSDDPSVGMAEIANASGVARATLYRHFSTREELIVAITERVFDDSERAITACNLAEGLPTEALRRLIAAMVALGDRYRFMFSQSIVMAPTEELRARVERLFTPVLQLLERGQTSGEFSRSIPSLWMLAALAAVIVAAESEMARGRLFDNTAEAVARILMHGFSPLETENQHQCGDAFKPVATS